MKLKDTNNGRVRELLRGGPQSTADIKQRLGLGHDTVMTVLRSMRRMKQIHGSHDQWRIAEWCESEEKFQKSALDRCLAGTREYRRQQFGISRSGEDEKRQAEVTNGVNKAILAWRVHVANPAHS